MIHPLKMAYASYLEKKYGVRIYVRLESARTEIVAQKVHRLGIDNDAFVELACGLWEDWSKKQGHPYPYWNMITSNKTFEWIEKLISTGAFQIVDCDSIEQQRMCETVFAMDYVSWILGEQVDKPVRVVIVSDDIKIAVAEELCRQHGVKYVSSNYGHIAQQVAETRDAK